ncbi:hypothetical protein BGZ75_010203 [Mortierella antarctica]|nr:hypothetical protein BGZ75_010203 [Mortierella antarctica]
MTKNTPVCSHCESNGQHSFKNGTSNGQSPKNGTHKSRAAHPRDKPVYDQNGSHKCLTDSIGQANPHGRSPYDLAVDASNGFIPLWDENVTLNYRFKAQNESDPQGRMDKARELFNDAIIKWGDASPVRFMENDELWDFQITLRSANEGGVLASAFFPDGGRHQLDIYPLMFTQSKHEQLDTMLHELGHVFGLRHFFAKINRIEKLYPSEIWGTHVPFSIMNYEDSLYPGEESCLTELDKSDLTSLYDMVWSRQLRSINRTPIVLFKPYHTHMP